MTVKLILKEEVEDNLKKVQNSLTKSHRERIKLFNYKNKDDLMNA